MPKHRGMVARSTTSDAFGHRWITTKNPRAWWYAARKVCGTRPQSREYLDQFGYEYPWRHLWLTHGRTFKAPALEEVNKSLQEDSFMEEGNCYANSLALSLAILRRKNDARGRVFYVEGLAIEPTGAYPHAWITIDNEVNDPTWPSSFLASYFGVAFDPFWMQDVVHEKGWVGAIDRWGTFEKPITEHLHKREVIKQKRS